MARTVFKSWKCSEPGQDSAVKSQCFAVTLLPLSCNTRIISTYFFIKTKRFGSELKGGTGVIGYNLGALLVTGYSKARLFLSFSRVSLQNFYSFRLIKG